jgi:hypothetical protein
MKAPMFNLFKESFMHYRSCAFRFLSVLCGAALAVFMMSHSARCEASPPLRVRSISLYHAWVDGSSKWPASKEFPTFESLIDRLAACGINEISLSAVMFLPMYCVDLAAIGYPEAVEFSTAEVERRRAIIDRNAAYAGSKGVRLLLDGYEHNVPAKFYFAHKEELNPQGRFDEPMRKHYGLETWRIEKERVVGNISWNRPLYKKFWTDAHREMLRVLPHVYGVRQTYGEWAWAYEEQNHGDNVRDYLRTWWQLLRDARGNDATLELRDWYVKAEELTHGDCPKVTVVAKDSGHDAASPLIGPWSLEYVKAGLPTLGEINLTEAENTRPILWFDPDYIRDRVQNLMAAGAAGFMARTGPPGSFVTDLEYRALKATAAEGKSFTATDAMAVLEPRFGPAAADVLRALQQSGFVLREYTKLYSGRWPWWQSDGVSINVLHTGFRGFDGFNDPLDHLRRDAVGIPDYIAYLQLPSKERSARDLAWKAAGLLPPPVILDRIRTAGAEAKAAALRAVENAPQTALRDPDQPLQQLAASACMAYHTSRLFVAYTELAIDYWLLKGGSEDKAVRGDLVEKLDQCAIEWSIIGRIGDRWFNKRITSSSAEGCWRKYADTLRKHLKVSYAGPPAEKIVVEPEGQ